MFDLSGKWALVTGSSRGIGKGVAFALAEAGADIVVNYAGSADKAAEVASEIQTMGRRALVIQADVSKPEDTEAVYEFVKDDNELKAVSTVFSELLEDADLI